jgi:archaellum component FlaC
MRNTKCEMESISPERRGGITRLDEVIQLITSLKETIAQQSSIIASQTNTIESQNSIIECIRTDLSAIKAEQRYLKNQNAELQETVESLRAQLNTLSIEPPSTQIWATVAASGRPAGPNTTSARSTNPGTADKENSRQLVIDVSKVREEVAESVATTEAVKQAIQQGMNGVERLAGATAKDFRVWRVNDSTSVIKFSVDKDKEAVFRQATDEWLDTQIPRARLVGPKWYPVKTDFIEVTLAIDAESGKLSKLAIERFSTENGVEMCTMQWL